MRPEAPHFRSLTVCGFVSCRREGLSTWRQIDFNAYKFIRLVAGRRIRGVAWLPIGASGDRRLSNANADTAAEIFLDWAVPMAVRARDEQSDIIVVPVPGPRRIVGSSPSRSRWLAHALAERIHRRMLDIFRWRQPMASCSNPSAQVFSDNVVMTGSPARGHCILVADFLSSHAPIQAIAARLQEYGSQPVLAITGGIAVGGGVENPFEAREERVDRFEPERI